MWEGYCQRAVRFMLGDNAIWHTDTAAEAQHAYYCVFRKKRHILVRILYCGIQYIVSTLDTELSMYDSFVLVLLPDQSCCLCVMRIFLHSALCRKDTVKKDNIFLSLRGQTSLSNILVTGSPCFHLRQSYITLYIQINRLMVCLTYQRHLKPISGLDTPFARQKISNTL